jgi:hypothetical protein
MSNWWGTYDVAMGHTLRWQIGPATLWVTRKQVEWSVGRVDGQDPVDNRLAIAEDSEVPDGDEAEVTRFAVQDESRAVRLTPALPDRPVIFRAARPFFVPSGEETTLFVSSPLWLRLDVGNKSTELLDLPLQRPSDTWFGPDTLTGELCYASRTSARLHLENVPLRPHRAITAVRIINRAGSSLPLEKLKVPVPGLGLFASGDGHLWTAALTLEREGDRDQARVRVTERPKTAAALTLVAQPRTPTSRGVLIDAFGGLLGRRAEQ